MSCAESSTATPSARASRASTDTTPCSLEMSRLASGSSSSSSLGLLIRACAIMTRCCSPPDSSPTLAFAYRCAPTAVSMSATSSRRARDGSRIPSLCPSSPRVTTSRTRSGMSGSMASFCGTYPMRASRAARGRPSMRTEPLVTGCRPRMTRSRVVLPAPFGPIRPVNWPGRMPKDTSRRISRPPSRTLTPSSRSRSSVTTGAPWRRGSPRRCAGPGLRPASRTGSRNQAGASSRRRPPPECRSASPA